MKPLPSLRQLRYLVEVVERRHFGAAAEACHVTQSTLSAGIQELEAILGISLLERTKRKVLPTDLGLKLAGRARALLQDAEDFVDLAQAAREPLTGSLRLGVIPTIGPFALPRVLPGLRRSHPSLRLYLVEDQTARLLDRLALGELDAAWIALPYDLEGLESALIADDHFLAALPKDHPLCHASRIDPAQLDPTELLLLEDGHCLKDHALAACRLPDVNTGFRGTSLNTLVQMVANGLGVTLLPELARESELFRGADIVLRPLPADSPPRQLGLVWRKSSGRKAEFQQLATELRRELQVKPQQV